MAGCQEGLSVVADIQAGLSLVAGNQAGLSLAAGKAELIVREVVRKGCLQWQMIK